MVGNPLPHPSPLEDAEREAEMVAQTLPAEELELLVGRAATKEAIVEAVRGATHVHLACHAQGNNLDEALTASLSLAGNDERLSADEILESARISRLDYRGVSPCETGVVQGYVICSTRALPSGRPSSGRVRPASWRRFGRSMITQRRF